MGNVFSRCILSKKPQSLRECMTQDTISASLWSWCEILETIGKVLCIIIGVAGFIIACALADDGGFWVFLVAIVVTAIIAFLQYITYHLLAILVGASASIVHNVKITASTMLYCADREENDSGEAGETPVKTASRAKKDVFSDSAPIDSYASGSWVCRKCNSKNGNDSRYCKNCGEYK